MSWPQQPPPGGWPQQPGPPPQAPPPRHPVGPHQPYPAGPHQPHPAGPRHGQPVGAPTGYGAMYTPQPLGNPTSRPVLRTYVLGALVVVGSPHSAVPWRIGRRLNPPFRSPRSTLFNLA